MWYKVRSIALHGIDYETNERRMVAMGREKKHEAQFVVRLPDELASRVDEHLARLNAATPGLEAKRSDAIRHLLTMALDAAEAKAKTAKR